MCELGSPEMVSSRETDCGDIGNAEPVISRRRRCQHRCLELSMLKSPGSLRMACQDGMCSESREPVAGRLGAPVGGPSLHTDLIETIKVIDWFDEALAAHTLKSA